MEIKRFNPDDGLVAEQQNSLLHYVSKGPPLFPNFILLPFKKYLYLQIKWISRTFWDSKYFLLMHFHRLMVGVKYILIQKSAIVRVEFAVSILLTVNWTLIMITQKTHL